MESIPALTTPARLPGCDVCSLSNVCLPVALHPDDMKRLNAVVRKAVFFDRGQRIFSQGASFTSCFVIKSGAIKTVMTSKRGDEKILGFYLPGEMFGLDGVNAGSYVCSAYALERSSVCEIPFERLEKLMSELPHLQHHLLRIMSREIAAAEDLGMLLSENTAEERIVSLVLTLSSRHARRKMPHLKFRLPMSRSDIANFLGLAVETVSRIFSRLQKAGLVKFSSREVEILDISALQRQLQQVTERDKACPLQLITMPRAGRS